MWQPSRDIVYAGTMEIFFFNVKSTGIILYTDFLDARLQLTALVSLDAVLAFLRSAAGKQVLNTILLRCMIRFPRCHAGTQGDQLDSELTTAAVPLFALLGL